MTRGHEVVPIEGFDRHLDADAPDDPYAGVARAVGVPAELLEAENGVNAAAMRSSAYAWSLRYMRRLWSI
jgi:hypothetical protein